MQTQYEHFAVIGCKFIPLSGEHLYDNGNRSRSIPQPSLENFCGFLRKESSNLQFIFTDDQSIIWVLIAADVYKRLADELTSTAFSLSQDSSRTLCSPSNTHLPLSRMTTKRDNSSLREDGLKSHPCLAKVERRLRMIPVIVRGWRGVRSRRSEKIVKEVGGLRTQRHGR